VVSRRIPEASAISITAVFPFSTKLYEPAIGRPIGSETVRCTSSPFSFSWISLQVPSPPSPIGKRATEQSSRLSRKPAPIAFAAACASRACLKALGATIMRFIGMQELTDKKIKQINHSHSDCTHEQGGNRKYPQHHGHSDTRKTRYYPKIRIVGMRNHHRASPHRQHRKHSCCFAIQPQRR